MKGNVEKSIKRWLKNKVKVTLGLMVSFLITGNVGYGDETYNGRLYLGGNTVIKVGNFTIESPNNIGLGYSGVLDVQNGNLKIDAGSNGIEGGYGGQLRILANEVNVTSGDNGIFVALEDPKGGLVTLGSQERKIDRLDIKADGQAIDAKLGNVEIYGTDDSIVTLHSTGASGIDKNQAAINNGYTNDKNEMTEAFIKIESGNIQLTADNGNGITNRIGTTILDTKSLTINASKGKLSSVDGIKNGTGMVEINSKDTVQIVSEGNGIYAKSDEIDKKGNIIINNENSLIDDKEYFSIEATEKALYSDNGGITLSSKGKITLGSKSDDNETYGVYAINKGEIKVSGDTLNITAIGKEIDGNDAKDINTNVTVSKIFNTTQGVRLEEGAKLDLEGVNNLNVTSSDVAVTANNANFNFEGNSEFVGNSYLVQNYTDNNLLVRPVLQAIDNGKIILSGDTTVISSTGEDGAEDDAKINNVGIYAQGNTGSQMVENVTINGNLTVISGNEVLTEKYNIKTLNELRNLTPGDFKELISNTDIALMATSGGKINIDSNENVFLIGDILSGKANSEVSVKGGKGNPDSMVVIGEVLAANGGKVNLDMSNGGYFVGRADDYFTINDEFKEAGFRNNKFDENIANGGTVSIKLGDNSVWNVVGQSYVTNLEFVEGSGVVDLTHEGNALRIKNLAGEGTFNITLDSENKESGNMLYVYNVVDNIDDVQQNQKMRSAVALFANEEPATENKVITQTVNLTDSVLNLQPGEKLRFATLGDQATGKVEFVANEVKERGINNVSYITENSAYDTKDIEQNNLYNGVEATEQKVGNSTVEDKATGFNPTENWYLTRGKETINDAGKTIIEMSKANYASAVYLDNLNKRLGDMTFAEGKEGFWVRLRNDRVGEDGEYRLHNYMTQLGYDKPYPMEEGKGTEYRGIAFEISKGDMDYKNINGDANVDRQALWLYDTNMYNNGFYSDYVFRAGRMESEFDIYGRETGVKVEGTYKNLFVGASAEYGYRYDLSEKTYLEPQVQLQYTYIDGTDYTTNQETKVELDEIHSVIGRAGARLGHDFYNKEGNKTATLYAKADINHEFLGDQRVKAKDKTGVIDKKYENDATWYDIGIGASKDVTPDFNVYMDVERQIGRTRDDQSWQFNLGFRYRFNDVKDLNPVVMLRDFTMKADNYFDFDKSELKPEGKKVVKEISNELTKENATGTLKIEGHTDSIGTNEYNQKLSERRAQSVENEFKQNITTDKIKYETRGYGEERPIADNATKEGRAKNRRVEINFGGTIEN